MKPFLFDTVCYHILLTLDKICKHHVMLRWVKTLEKKSECILYMKNWFQGLKPAFLSSNYKIFNHANLFWFQAMLLIFASRMFSPTMIFTVVFWHPAAEMIISSSLFPFGSSGLKPYLHLNTKLCDFLSPFPATYHYSCFTEQDRVFWEMKRKDKLCLYYGKLTWSINVIKHNQLGYHSCNIHYYKEIWFSEPRSMRIWQSK